MFILFKSLSQFIFEFIHLISSGGPCYVVDRYLRIFGHQRVFVFLLRHQLFQLGEALLEFLFGGRILAHCANQLDGVQSSLVTVIVEQLDDLIELVQIVNLHFSLLLLGEGGQRSGRSGPHLGNFVRKHDAKRFDGSSFDGLFLSQRVVGNRSNV